ncbi:uncharacterized protein [Populus alba]|uniref:uncharacterized protein n=1 Tax=Populus alba TaxID=43335 RepID=UPI003CC799D6
MRGAEDECEEDEMFGIKENQIDAERVIFLQLWIDVIRDEGDWKSGIHVHFDNPGAFSNHSPATVSFHSRLQMGKKCFKFFNIWTNHASFLKLIADNWQYEVHGSPMFILCKRLKHLKGPKLNKLHFSHISDRVARAEAAMDAHQTLSSNDRGNTQLYAIDKHLQQHLIHLKAAESDGTFTSFVDEVGAVFVDFYSQLLGTPKATLPLDVTVIQHGPCLDTDSLASLLASVSDMDIKYALFAIDDAKVIAKILTVRLSHALATIISPMQNAFLGGRLMAYNIHLVQELLINYERKRTPPRCLMKINFKKAFDSVQWPFLRQLLLLLGFPSCFVHLVMQCVETASYSIAINGSIYGFFSRKNGVRQGDPLSPYLFTACMEYLSRMLHMASLSLGFRFHLKCATHSICHLAFADDVNLLSMGDRRYVTSLF